MSGKLKRKGATSSIEVTDKRVKTSKSQTNTLLNYFSSAKSTSIKIEETSTNESSKSDNFSNNVDNKCLIKTEVAALKIESKENNEFIELIENKNDNSVQTSTKSSQVQQAWLKIFNKTEKIETKKHEIKQEITELKDIFEEEENKTNKTYRKCPFYKYISNTPITVDAFNYGIIENCKAYFLSHFHYDHYIGLNKNFQQILYCSEITANLVIKVIKVNAKYIRALPLNKFQNVFENDTRIQVALLDANHCPGSVMFLFYFKDTKRYILHTGDFRAAQNVIENPMLQNIDIDLLYLDTTYCDSYYKFDPQDVIINLGVKTVEDELKKYPKSLIICGSYTIGKERIFTSIAHQIQSKIYVKREKKNILDCLNDEKLKTNLTLDPNETNLHVLPMGFLNINDLNQYLEKFPQYNRIIAIKPTGWTHNSDSSLNVEAKRHNIVIYGLAYSEHSSFTELKNFVKFLRPNRIFPTVNNANKLSRDKMKNYFQEWLNNK